MYETNANEQYLQSTVLTASPAKLRSMLLDRAVAVVEAIRESRKSDPDQLVDQWTLRLRDLLGELLSGVSRGGGELAKQVSDLYVFLLQELTRAEQEPGLERIDSIGHILRIEQETWRLVCDSQTQRPPAASRMAPPPPHTTSGTLGGAPIAASGPPGGSLNLSM